MAKIADMTLEERETHMNLSGEERAAGKDWEVYTDDPVFIREMERKKIPLLRTTAGGGKYFSLPQNQLTIRKKREMTDEARAELSRRAKENFATARPQSSVGALEMGMDLEDIDEEGDEIGE